jgi:hypothetical protein
MPLRARTSIGRTQDVVVPDKDAKSCMKYGAARQPEKPIMSRFLQGRISI